MRSNAGFKREYFDSQSIVFRCGETGDAAYVIESGCVEVLLDTAQEQRRIAVLAQGAMFGEVALLDRQARTATVRALVPTTLVRIDRAHVEELLQRADPVIQYLLSILLERFRSSSGAHDAGGSLLMPAETAEGQEHVADLHSAAVRTLSLAHDLSDAIDGGQLALFYQPIIGLTGKEIVGYESLVRWKHPTLGLVSPDEFIPLAEKTGLVHRIGQWVLGQAATDWPSLRQSCNGSREHPPFIAVNLSAPELCSPAMAASIDACLARHTMPPAELHIELTETVIVNSMEKVSVTIGHLTEQNVGIALDDFGTGYAGLDYLQNLPFTCLKIDKTFVQQMHTSQRSFQIVKSAIELARSMSLTTVAEGIEDEATGQLLESMGCTYAQGYLYARPLPLAEVGQWAARFRSLPIS